MPERNKLPEAQVEDARNTPIMGVLARLGYPDVPEGAAFSSLFRTDNHPSCQAGGKQNTYHDHATGETLDTIGLVMKVRGCGFQEGVAFVLDKATLALNNGHPLDWNDTIGNHDKPANGKKQVWTVEEAQVLFEALPFASSDSEAVNLQQVEYGIPVEFIPKEWRVGEYPGLGKGLVYVGFRPDYTPFSITALSKEMQSTSANPVFFPGTHRVQCCFPLKTRYW
jgi:hypothetical protein